MLLWCVRLSIMRPAPYTLRSLQPQSSDYSRDSVSAVCCASALHVEGRGVQSPTEQHLSSGLVKAFSAISNLSFIHRVHCQPSIEDKDRRIAQMSNGQLCFLISSFFLLAIIVMGTGMDLWPKSCSMSNRTNIVDFEMKRSKIRRRRHHNSLRCEVESTSSISSFGSSKIVLQEYIEVFMNCSLTGEKNLMNIHESDSIRFICKIDANNGPSVDTVAKRLVGVLCNNETGKCIRLTWSRSELKYSSLQDLVYCQVSDSKLSHSQVNDSQLSDCQVNVNDSQLSDCQVNDSQLSDCSHLKVYQLDLLSNLHPSPRLQDLRIPISMFRNTYRERKMQKMSTRSLSEKVKQIKWWKRLFLAFSLRTNVRWLLQTSRNKDTSPDRYSNRIKCLFGLKTLTAIWVVAGHTYFFSLSHTSNMAYVARLLPDQIFAQIILNGTLSVDTFFLISGLLTAYVCSKRALNGGASAHAAVVKWSIYYVHRLFRLLPPYAFVYLAVDFQMYVISPIFLIMLQKVPKIGICFIILCILTSSIVQGIWTSIRHLPTNMILFLPDKHFDNDFKRHFETIYQKTYFRCGPYLIGLLMGWALADGRIKSRQCRFSLFQKAALFSSTFGFCLWALFGAFPLMNGPFSSVYNGIYATLNRTSWCIGSNSSAKKELLSLPRTALKYRIALLIYVCQASRESHMINNLLSAKFFWPLSRVTYSNYLSHELLILYTYYSLQNPITFENHWSILRYAAFFIFSSYFVSFLLFLLVEGPILSAERLLFRRKPKNSTPPDNNGDVTLVSHRQMTEQWVESLQEFEDIAQEYDNINEDDKN
uniref:Acyltransferase 3 domain-containing protein n=1 Tax=Romanomermis culicivorax TaxID=13658 RepID=A0A915JKV4_ROMCU